MEKLAARARCSATPTVLSVNCIKTDELDDGDDDEDEYSDEDEYID